MHLVGGLLLSLLAFTMVSANSNNKAIVQQLLKDNTDYLQLTDSLFTKYTKQPRNYSLVLLTTALDPKIGCEPCRKLDPEFKMVAYSYMHALSSPSDAQIYFAIIDFAQGKDTFAQLQLQSAPNVFYFNKDGDMASWDMSGFDADHLVNWIHGVSGIRIQIIRPFDYQKLIFNLASIGFFLALLKFVVTKFWFVINNSSVWAMISLLFIIHMSSGYMWNQIRGASYAGKGANGKMEVIQGSFGSQYQVETQIVTMIYSILAASIVFLVNRIPKISNPYFQRVATFIGLGVFIFTYSFLISIFRFKNGGYPFRLLL